MNTLPINPSPSLPGSRSLLFSVPKHNTIANRLEYLILCDYIIFVFVVGKKSLWNTGTKPSRFDVIRVCVLVVGKYNKSLLCVVGKLLDYSTWAHSHSVAIPVYATWIFVCVYRYSTDNKSGKKISIFPSSSFSRHSSLFPSDCMLWSCCSVSCEWNKWMVFNVCAAKKMHIIHKHQYE